MQRIYFNGAAAHHLAYVPPAVQVISSFFIAPIIYDQDDNGRGGRIATPSITAHAPSIDLGNVPTHPGLKHSASRWIRRSATVTLCCVLVIMVASLFLRFRSRMGNLARPSVELTQLTESGTARTAAISPDGRYVAYAQGNKEGYSSRLRQVATNSDAEFSRRNRVTFSDLAFHLTVSSFISSVPTRKIGHLGTCTGFHCSGVGSRNLLLISIHSSVSHRMGGNWRTNVVSRRAMMSN